jgi:hypothetical protein
MSMGIGGEKGAGETSSSLGWVDEKEVMEKGYQLGNNGLCRHSSRHCHGDLTATAHLGSLGGEQN